MPSNLTRLCAFCGARFTPRLGANPKHGRFCSRSCAVRWQRAQFDHVTQFWESVNRSAGPDECWPFTGNTTRSGYGRVTIKGKIIRAHRFAYELLVGPIPDGWHVHHRTEHGCTTRRCCNPTHLEALPAPDHASLYGWQQHRTHCPNGHPYDELNTRINRQGGRECRACHRAKDQLRRQKQ